MKTTVVSFFVLFSLLISTFFAFDHWQQDYSATDEFDVVELSQESRLQSLSIPNGKNLVPIGAVLGENDINIITYTYLVKNSESSLSNISISNVLFSRDNQFFDDVYGLVNFEVELDSSLSSLEYSVITVSVSLNMPVNQLEADFLRNSNISFILKVI